jgi:glutamine phosphoribosylpyrophosphate amidotransferase
MVDPCEISESFPTQDEGKPRESCGLFGVYGDPAAASLIYRGLFSLQHRGQEGAGIVVSDGQNIQSIKGMGLVGEVVAKQGIGHLKGHIGIGHVRYSTTGSSRIQNVQPLVAECADGLWVVAHNGNLVNAGRLRKMYQESGSIFQTSTDSEVLMHLLADPMYRNRPQRLAQRDLRAEPDRRAICARCAARRTGHRGCGRPEKLYILRAQRMQLAVRF